MLRTNETKTIKWYETCKYIFRLNAIICNKKQHWHKNKYRCKCKKLIDKFLCDKGFIWNPGNGKCECNKSCNFSEYLDYKNCECRKMLVNKYIDECNKTIDEVKLTKITLTENENSYKHNSCILYIVLFSILFTINVGIGAYFVYYKYMNRNKKMFLNIKIMFIKQQFK